MTVLAENGRRKLWFGTVDRMEWLPTPNRGADVSPTGWSAGGELLSGGAYQFGSFNSAKNYQFEWPASSSREAAQLMKSYADGSYGRGLVYFVDPLTYSTNVLPALWADPSMAVGSESNTLVPGITPTGTPTSGNPDLRLPVQSAFYDLSLTGTTGPDNLDDSNSVFVPVPEGYTLALGAVYSATGSAGVFYSPVFQGGAISGSVKLNPVDPNGAAIINTVATPTPGQIGVRVWIGKTSSGASSITLSAVIGRLLRTDVSTPREIARNYFTNPNLKGDGTFAEVYRNYFTNPNLVGDGTWAEVRRNFDPIPAATANWPKNSATGTVETLSGSGLPAGLPDTFCKATKAAGESPSTFGMYRPLGMLGLSAGQVITASRYVRSSVSGKVRINLEWGGGSFSYREFDLVANTWARVSITEPIPATATGITASVFAQNFPGGASLDQTASLVELSPIVQPYLDGSTKPAGITQPEDFRVRWLGTPNASVSVMEIERVRGLIGNRAVVGVSSVDGKPAARVINIPDSSATSGTPSSMQFDFPAAIQNSLTVVGTLHAKVPHDPASLAAYRNLTYIGSPDQPSNPVLARFDDAGTFPSRISGQSGNRIARWYGDGATSTRDTWWSDIGVFAGIYPGPVFSGDAVPSSLAQPEDFRARWVGTPNASDSVIEGERAAGLGTFNAVGIVSTKAGKRAVRVIPTAASNGSNINFAIPTPLLSGGVFCATIHLDAPLIGTLNSNTRIITAQNPFKASEMAPNAAGSLSQRVEFGALTGAVGALRHGGSIGSGDVWWTDIGLFGPGYTGPVFSGSSTQAGSVSYSWAGTPDNSESIATFTPRELVEAQAGPWTGGQGHSGCRFTGYPTYINHTGTDGGQVSYAASFREVGSWVMG